MNTNYAELKLYYGLCDSDGCPEGKFYPDRTDDWSVRMFKYAIDLVNKNIDPNYPWKSVRLGWEHFVESEDEARKLIDYAQYNIRGARSELSLVKCMHGNIAFWRKIDFDGWKKDQEQFLIEELKKSGYIPTDKERVRLENMYRQILPEEEFNRTIKEFLDGRDPDRFWKEALRFY
jgi:hypothetical protein